MGCNNFALILSQTTKKRLPSNEQMAQMNLSVTATSKLHQPVEINLLSCTWMETHV